MSWVKGSTREVEQGTDALNRSRRDALEVKFEAEASTGTSPRSLQDLVRSEDPGR